LIAKLYKEEEWPLKQVIKKIRSDNFNPRWDKYGKHKHYSMC
jgi:hypothetical protein